LNNVLPVNGAYMDYCLNVGVGKGDDRLSSRWIRVQQDAPVPLPSDQGHCLYEVQGLPEAHAVPVHCHREGLVLALGVQNRVEQGLHENRGVDRHYAVDGDDGDHHVVVAVDGRHDGSLLHSSHLQHRGHGRQSMKHSLYLSGHNRSVFSVSSAYPFLKKNGLSKEQTTDYQ